MIGSHAEDFKKCLLQQRRILKKFRDWRCQSPRDYDVLLRTTRAQREQPRRKPGSWHKISLQRCLGILDDKRCVERDECNKEKKLKVQYSNGPVQFFYVLEDMVMSHPPFADDDNPDDID